MKIKKYYNSKNTCGSILRKFRLQAGLTQESLAEKLQLLGIELTAKEISKIEKNNRLVQDFELFAFAKVFNVPTDIFNSKNS